MVTRIRRRVTTALAAAILLTTAGCLNVNVDTGDIPPIPDRVVGSTAPPATGYRYTPYGLELRSVLSQQASVEKELAKRTLTSLYNENPTWLRLAHERLDKSVLDAYGWPQNLTDEQILERLLALNLERAGGT